MPPSKLCRQITIDICIFIFFMCLPLLALFIWGQPATNGFWCYDQSLSFPYKPDTVSQNLLLLVGFGAPFFVMTVTEIMRAALKTKVPRRFRREMFCLAKAYGVFMFGVATNVMFTDTIKYSVGRLRPHFFDLCKPDFVKVNCTDNNIARPPPYRYASDKFTSQVLTAPCGNLSHYDGLIVVHSKAMGFERRHDYRLTYGDYGFTRPRRMKLVFLIGLPRQQHGQDMIKKEHFLYGDTIQGNFVDAYVNLTYKAVMGFRWMSEMCYDVKVVIKMDDDVLLDVPRFFQDVWPPPVYLRHMLQCHMWVFAEVQRTGKWKLDRREHKGKVFPPYCSGFFVVIPFYVTAELYRYVSEYECTNTEVDHHLLRDSRLSFPSGHASLSIYSALFTVFYLQLRMKVSFSYLLRPVIQVFMVVAALLCCLTRITDHKHFLTDVLAGSILGMAVAWLSFYKLGHKLIPTPEPQQAPPSHIRRATSIESEPQTPTPLLRPERLVLSHNHLQHNGFRNGTGQATGKDQFGNV